jgi:hypothetical protein
VQTRQACRTSGRVDHPQVWRRIDKRVESTGHDLIKAQLAADWFHQRPSPISFSRLVVLVSINL